MQDSFNRADTTTAAAIGAGSVGPAPTFAASNARILSNQLSMGSAYAVTWATNGSDTQRTLQAKYVIAGNTFDGLYLSQGWIWHPSGTVECGNAAGAGTVGAYTAGAVIKAVSSGAATTFYVNGVSVGSVGLAITGSVKAGVQGQVGATWDDVLITTP